MISLKIFVFFETEQTRFKEQNEIGDCFFDLLNLFDDCITPSIPHIFASFYIDFISGNNRHLFQGICKFDIFVCFLIVEILEEHCA